MAATGGDAAGLDDLEMIPPSYSRQASAMTQTSKRDRLRTLGRSMKNSVADFFGVGDECPEVQEKWRQRSRNLACKRSVGGGVKPSMTRAGTMDSVFMDPAGGGGGTTPGTAMPMTATANYGRNHPLSSSFHGHPLSSSFHGHPLSASFQSRPMPTPIDPLHRPGRQFSHTSRGPLPSRQLSRQISTASSSRRSTRLQPSRRSRKDSVVKMAYDGVKTIMDDSKRPEDTSRVSIRRTPTRKSSKRKPYLRSRSFAPTSISSYQDEMDTLKNNDILQEILRESRIRENQLRVEPPGPRQQLSMMSYISNMSYFSAGFSDRSQSPMPDSVFADDSVLDDVFFDVPIPGSPLVAPFLGPPPLLHLGDGGHRAPPSTAQEEGAASATLALPTLWEASRTSQQEETLEEGAPPAGSDEDDHRGENGKTEETKPLRSRRGKLTRQEALRHDSDEGPPASPKGTAAGRWIAVTQRSRPLSRGWTIGRQRPLPRPGTPGVPATPEPGFLPQLAEDEVDGAFSPMCRMPEKLVDQVEENSNRREIGKGLVGRLFKRSYRRERIDSDIKAQLDDIDDHRPYFTYWVTFVQVLIYVISVAVYGIAPIGFEETIIKAEVMMPSLAIEKKYYFEQDNFWIGPRQADLIHLGAKYSPCMRKDENIEAALNIDRAKENLTACCIRNDGSGCVQMAKDQCSQTLSTWYSWKEEKWSEKRESRTSGSVCGLDPRTCLNPASSGAFTWKDDITSWPICKNVPNSAQTSNYKHMNCEVVGRPCCVGIQGECIITTREYCTFRRGYFHEEASLCSQVSCMTEICGMIPFLYQDRPDQFYRFWTSLFLHAGLLQLVVTVLFQFFVMRDLEKLAGWLRIAIIYLGSGIAGSMSSAIFLPYHVEAGPAGSQFGLLACLIVEVIQNWYILQHPMHSALKLVIIVLVLFCIGLLPMVDNYAHLVGFIFGTLLSFAMLPYVTFGRFDRRRKIIGIVLCLFTAAGLLALLVVLFYVIGVYDCPNCHYFNCIPFTPKFCKSMEVKIGRTETY